MLKYIGERADRLHASCDGVKNVKTKLPLMAEIGLSADEIGAIRSYSNMYLYDSLAGVFGCRHLSNNMLVDHAGDIARLPNITPNGLLLPKRHNLLSYNMLVGCVTGLIKSLGLNGASKFHFPINLRIVNGAPNEAIDSRPRASVKLHSDIWAGEFADHVMIFIPLFGDMQSNGVELYEPGDDFYPDYVKPMVYDDGAHLINKATKYDVEMSAGNLYLLDSFLLHRTMKRKPGLRMVINFAFIPEDKVESDLAVTTRRHDEYIAAGLWYQLGHSKIITTNSVVRQFTAEETNAVRNQYADEYAIVDI